MRMREQDGAVRQEADANYVRELRGWQSRSVELNGFECTPIKLSESDQWLLQDGQLRHRTGGFFQLAGIAAEARDPFLDGRQQLIILQRQIAINGFLMRRGDLGAEILFQGRVEPGNVNGMQLAPTVQSTETNYRRVHGGGPTAFVDWFLEPGRAQPLFDALQSEEATRYHGKYNRNVVLQLPADTECDPPFSFRWYGLEALRQFAITSNALNTDARSVLSCVDWALLAGPEGVFGGHPPGSFGAALRASYVADEDQEEISSLDLMQWLTNLRVRCGLRTRVLRLDELENWILEPDGIREREREQGFGVRQFRVVATGREVKSWDQPLVVSAGVGRLALACQEREGVLRLLVKASREIGFLEGIQLSASITIAPGEPGRPEDPVEHSLAELIAVGEQARVLQSCRQSEEGGRFYRDENDYEIVLLDPSVRLPESDDYRWLTLAQIRRLMGVSGTFSIELRGVLALLLAYL